MNWFMYIGGGIIFIPVVVFLVAKIFVSGSPSASIGDAFWITGMLGGVPIASIWIWICWKFIRNSK